MEGLVSVIVPAYNHEDFIASALESVSTQSYGNIELIVIDDCSRDATFERAKAWAKDRAGRFQRLKIVRNRRNLGAARTINAGLTLARGDWLTILNSDDCYCPTRFEKLLAAIASSGRRHAFSGLEIIDKGGESFASSPLNSWFRALPDRLETYPEIGIAILERNIAFTSGNLFFHRKLYEQAGEFADMKLSHDWDYLIRLLALDEPAYVSEQLYFYRLYDQNTWPALKLEHFLDPQMIMRRYFMLIRSCNYKNIKFPLYMEWSNLKRTRELRPLLDRTDPPWQTIAAGIAYGARNLDICN